MLGLRSPEGRAAAPVTMPEPSVPATPVAGLALISGSAGRDHARGPDPHRAAA
jgi:hypothetical protein